MPNAAPRRLAAPRRSRERYPWGTRTDESNNLGRQSINNLRGDTLIKVHLYLVIEASIRDWRLTMTCRDVDAWTRAMDGRHKPVELRMRSIV